MYETFSSSSSPNMLCNFYHSLRSSISLCFHFVFPWWLITLCILKVCLLAIHIVISSNLFLILMDYLQLIIIYHLNISPSIYSEYRLCAVNSFPIFGLPFPPSPSPHSIKDLSSTPGIEPEPPAVEARNPNQWTTREFLPFHFINGIFLRDRSFSFKWILSFFSFKVHAFYIQPKELQPVSRLRKFPHFSPFTLFKHLIIQYIWSLSLCMMQERTVVHLLA